MEPKVAAFPRERLGKHASPATDTHSTTEELLLSRNMKIIIYKFIIFPLVLYGCESWSLVLRKEYRLSMFENSVLRRIFGPNNDEIIGG
jgi:hypothetical protein